MGIAAYSSRFYWGYRANQLLLLGIATVTVIVDEAVESAMRNDKSKI